MLSNSLLCVNEPFFLFWQFLPDLFAVEEYQRSWEQNEDLGLNDMDTSCADAAYDSSNDQLNDGSVAEQH